MSALILINGNIVTPEGIVQGNIIIKDGTIVSVGGTEQASGKIIDCTDRYILPGLIDIHVHFRDPGFPEKGNFETESKAAAAGGVTTIFDMPNTEPPTVTVEALEAKRKIAAQKSLVNVRLYMGLTNDNLEEIKKAKDIVGIKVYMGSSTGNLLVQDMNVIERLFQYLAESKRDLPIVVHAEDETLIREHTERYGASDDPAIHSLIRNVDVATLAVKNILHLAKKYDVRLHITHISTVAELEEIKKFKTGLISCDVTPHHLFLTLEAYRERGNFMKVNPPLRTEKDRAALWRALQSAFAPHCGASAGTIDLIATDHAPHTKAEKERLYRDAPAGVPEIQTVLPLLLDSVNHGQLSIRDVVRLTAETPARLFNLPSKGKIAVGFDADLVVVDMEKEQELTEKMLLYKCGWSPYTGWKLKGWPEMTLVRGKIITQGT